MTAQHTTIYTVSKNPEDLALHSAVISLTDWAGDNSVIINEGKCKEMVIYFGSKIKKETIAGITINNKLVERVDKFKLLGVFISADLSWDSHVNYIVTKASKRLYCIRILVHIGIPADDIILIYCSIVRSVLEYACPVWHPGLTQKQSKDIERIQKRCLSMIFPNLKYTESLQCSGLERLDTRRDKLTNDLFCQIKEPSHILHEIIPQRNSTVSSQLRNSYPFQIPLCKPSRYGRDFIPYCIKKRF